MADLKTPAEPPPDYEVVAAQDRPSEPPAQSGVAPRKGAPVPLPPLQLPILKYMRTKRVILASASPRRRALLAQLGLTNLEIRASTKPEDLPKSDYGPYEYVAATARRKCLDVYEHILAEQEYLSTQGAPAPPDPDLVIAADTVILARDGRIIEKPRNEADHVRMLQHLRDTVVHRVLTSVCVVAPRADASYPGYEIAAHTEETRVHFASVEDGLPDDVIEAYVKTREGADKAGGYAVQGIGGMVLVDKLDGPVDNVVGLPVRKCLQLCEKVVFRQGEDEEAEDDEE